VGDYTIVTDQPVDQGGDASAPAPFDLFLASIATCAGYYVYEFCLKRDISVEGIEVAMHVEKNQETKRWTPIDIEIRLPSGFRR